MSETRKIVVLAGDGIGPEIVGATRQVLDAVGDFEYTDHLIGGASIDEHGVALTDEVIAALGVVNRQEPFAELFGDYEDPWNFAGPEETEIRLVDAGYEDVECWLEERVAHPEDPRGFFEASFLAPAQQTLDPDLFTEYTDRLLGEMGGPTSFNYVRLNMTAKRKNENE